MPRRPALRCCSRRKSFPVAAPKLAAKLPAVLRPEDLAKLTLLAFDNGHKAPWFSWEPWLIGLGLAHARPKAVLEFNQYDQLIRAAEDGRGIALGRGPLVGHLIAERKLRPLGKSRQRVAARGYFLVRAPGVARPEVEGFAAWLLAEANKTVREAEK